MAEKLKTPWAKAAGEVPLTLEYRNGTMFDAVVETSNKYPHYIAFDFMGKKTNYSDFVNHIHMVARSLSSIGVKPGDNVTIALPNCPQALCLFYAVNLVGAVSNMVHPLSAESEVEFYLKFSKSKVFITLDQFYPKFKDAIKRAKVKKVVLASVKDELTIIKRYAYLLTQGRKIAKVSEDKNLYYWPTFIRSGATYFGNYMCHKNKDDVAVILYSGGTTGTTKGIALTNFNFNALSAQIVATNPMYKPGDKVLAAMPVFHGFGLGVSIHSFLSNGGRCILVPRFTPDSYCKLMTKYKVNFIAGVPTLFEAMLRVKGMKRANLSSLKGVFSGGDSLSIELKKKFDKFLKDHKAKIEVREGYGTTECVTASCLTPLTEAKEGSIGIPFPDTYYKIVKPGTTEELPFKEEGEIVLTGPTVMKEYVHNPEETAQTLRKHADGHVWLHTGDLGYMDKDGYIYFKGRIKRMIVVSGYNVYPQQLENILDAHEAVHMSCVIGVPDPYKMHKVKAFVMLKNGYSWSEHLRHELLTYCKKHIAKYALPYDIEYREVLPKTLVGKVAYRELEKEELEKLAKK